MECREVQKMLSEYIDGVLSENLAPVVKQHLATCPECRDMYHSMNRLIGVMREMETVDEPDGLRAGVRARLEHKPSFTDRFRWLISPPRIKVPLTIAAAAVVAVMIFVLPRPEHPAKDRQAVSGEQPGVPSGPVVGGRSDEVAATLETDQSGDSEKAGKIGNVDETGAADRVAKAGEPAQEKKEKSRADEPASPAQTESGTELTYGGVTTEKRAEPPADRETQSRPEDDTSGLFATLEEIEIPVKTRPDSAAVDSIPVPAKPHPVDARVAAVGGTVVGTELDENGERIALIARIPADSLQALYRYFGETNVTRALGLYGAPEGEQSQFESKQPRATASSRSRAESVATPTAPTDSLVVRIRIKP